MTDIFINYLQYETLPKLSFWKKLFLSDLNILEIENKINDKNFKLWKKHVANCLREHIIPPEKPKRLSYTKELK